MKPSASARPSQQVRVLWQTSFDKPIVGLPVAVADGVVVALKPADDRSLGMLQRIDVESGTARWTSPTPAGAIGQPSRTGHWVGLALADDSVCVWDLDDGRQVGVPWPAVRSGLSRTLASFRERFVVRSGSGVDAVISAYELGSVEPVWVRPDPLAGARCGVARLTAGVLVLGGQRVDGQAFVTGLNFDDGQTIWAFQRGDCVLNDIWAVAGQVDIVTSTAVIGVDAATGVSRPERFTNFPLDTAIAAGEHLVAVMEGHDGAVLLCFDAVGQRLTGRIDGSVRRLIGAHPDEVLVSLIDKGPAFFSLPDLEPIGFPEADALGEVRGVCWARDVCYVVGAAGRTLTAIDLAADA